MAFKYDSLWVIQVLACSGRARRRTSRGPRQGNSQRDPIYDCTLPVVAPELEDETPISDCTLPVVAPELEDETTLRGAHTEAKRLKHQNIHRKILANLGVQLRAIDGYFLIFQFEPI